MENPQREGFQNTIVNHAIHRGALSQSGCGPDWTIVPSDKGNQYILTVVDYTMRYPELIALPKIETERVAEALLEVLSRVGLPKELLCDRGTRFTSDLMKEVC